VLHLVNDAEANVFNGDIGYITDLVPAKYTESKQDEIFFDFDGNELIYPRNEWYKITLAYAMSIHKSQGSEFPVVILPITHSSRRMLQRNLLYTAITRSKSKLILLGEFQAFQYAIQNKGVDRQTFLVERFLGLDETEIPTATEVVENVTEDKTLSSETIDTGHPAESEQFIEEPPIIEEKEYRLTPENYLLVDPMIGLSTEDIEQFFGEK
jgi:exodeoxyribonuclease V alpha subunit